MSRRFVVGPDEAVATWSAVAVDDPGGGIAGVVEARLGPAVAVVVDLAAPDRLAEVRVEAPDLDPARAPDEAVLAALAALLGDAAARLARAGRAGTVEVGADALGHQEPLARLLVAVHDEHAAADWGTRLVAALVDELDPRVRALLGAGGRELAVPAGPTAGWGLAPPPWVERRTGALPVSVGAAPLPALVDAAATSLDRPAGVPVLGAATRVELADGSTHLLHGGLVRLDGMVAPVDAVDVGRDARVVWDRTTGELELRVPLLGAAPGLWARVSDRDGAPVWIAPLRPAGDDATARGPLPGGVPLDDVVVSVGLDPLVPPPPAPVRAGARAAALGRLAVRAEELGADEAARDAWRRAGAAWARAGRPDRAARCRHRAGEPLRPAGPAGPSSPAAPAPGSVDRDGRARRRTAAPWWSIGLAVLGALALVASLVLVARDDPAPVGAVAGAPTTVPPGPTTTTPTSIAVAAPESEAVLELDGPTPPVVLGEPFDVPGATMVWSDEFGWGAGATVTPDDGIVVGADRTFDFTLRWEGLTNPGYARRAGETPEETAARCEAEIPFRPSWGGSGSTTPVFYLGRSADPADYTLDRGRVGGPLVVPAPIGVGLLSYQVGHPVVACSTAPHPLDPDRLISIAERLSTANLPMRGLLPTDVPVGEHYLIPVWPEDRWAGGPFSLSGTLVPVRVTAPGGVFADDAAEPAPGEAP